MYLFISDIRLACTLLTFSSIINRDNMQGEKVGVTEKLTAVGFLRYPRRFSIDFRSFLPKEQAGRKG